MTRTLDPFETNEINKYQQDLPDLSKLGNKPIQYYTGHAEFLKHDFLINEDVLIPRLESEKIVELALEFLSEHSELTHPTIADIGTGSGCLGVSLASNLIQQQSPYTIYLSDISPKALKIAQKNAFHLLTSPLNLFFLESDLLTHFPPIKFDLVLANLPYIPSNLVNQLDSSVKDYEPHLALDGGPDGATLINKLLKQLPKFASENHFCAILEIDDTHQKADFEIPEGFASQLKNDLFGVPRFLVLNR